jgi:ribose transport system substrate-binding protein
MNVRPCWFARAAAAAVLAVLACGCNAGGTGKDKPIRARSGGSADAAPDSPSEPYSVANPRKPPAGAEPRYVLITNGDSPFWTAARIGMENGGKDLSVKVDLMTNDGTIDGQMQKLRQIATQGDIVGIGISVLEARAEGVADEMYNLQQKGVHVVTVDSDLDRARFDGARFAFIGTDNLQGGRELGIAAKGLRPDGGKYVTFVGITSAQNAEERVGGFGQGAGDNFTKADNMGDEIDPDRARSNVRNAIRNHPDVKTLVGIWSYNAPAIVDVVKELNRRKDFTIVTFDAEPDAVAQMADGQIDAMVVQNPYEMGYQCVRLLKALVNAEDATIKEMLPKLGEPGGNIYDTGLKVVVPDEESPLKPEMFGEKTQFMKLGDFRDWLKKYGLTGS